MNADSYYIAAGITLAVLSLSAVLIGRAATGNWIGILIDGRGRYSLNRLQIVMWTILVLTTLVGVAFSTMQLPEIPTTLLGLMGISVGSLVTAGAVDSHKDSDPNAKVARAGDHSLSDGTSRQIVPKLSQIYLEEEGDRADVTVSVSKFQLLLFTAVLGVVYAVLSVQEKGFPDLTNGAVWLTAISHAGHIVGAVPNKR